MIFNFFISVIVFFTGSKITTKQEKKNFNVPGPVVLSAGQSGNSTLFRKMLLSEVIFIFLNPE